MDTTALTQALIRIALENRAKEAEHGAEAARAERAYVELVRKYKNGEVVKVKAGEKVVRHVIKNALYDNLNVQYLTAQVFDNGTVASAPYCRVTESSIIGNA